MNPPFAPSTPGQTIFARLRHAISRVPNPSPSKKRKWIVLIAVGLLLAAIFWIQRAPSHEERLAYRMGYGMGQAMKTEGAKVDLEEIAAEMGIDSAEKDMFEDGFSDGSKGRDPRYDAPSTSERYVQPEISAPPTLFTDEEAAEIMRSMGKSAEPPTSLPAAPQKPADKNNRFDSPPSDYAINPLYGETPPTTETTQDTNKE